MGERVEKGIWGRSVRAKPVFRFEGVGEVRSEFGGEKDCMRMVVVVVVVAAREGGGEKRGVRIG